MDQFINAYKTALTRYVDFSGRTSVGGFWRFVAVNFVVALLLAILSGIVDFFIILYFLYALAVFLPSLAVAIRRLHDTGKSGWMILLGLIPLRRVHHPDRVLRAAERRPERLRLRPRRLTPLRSGSDPLRYAARTRISRS